MIILNKKFLFLVFLKYIEIKFVFILVSVSYVIFSTSLQESHHKFGKFLMADLSKVQKHKFYSQLFLQVSISQYIKFIKYFIILMGKFANNYSYLIYNKLKDKSYFIVPLLKCINLLICKLESHC